MIIDLTMPLNEETPVWEGDPPFKTTEEATVETNGCAMHTIKTLNHAGTHIDAPSHMIAGELVPIGNVHIAVL